ncbi:cobalamin biosynthesis protein CobQ, partial [Candidatus Roizmanbacteria bacterium CG03_land_8_20_14_0_80_39_12]
MSTYGDRGNILYFRKRCDQRNIGTELLSIDSSFSSGQFKDLDFIFGGGSQ